VTGNFRTYKPIKLTPIRPTLRIVGFTPPDSNFGLYLPYVNIIRLVEVTNFVRCP
jgi:hypothetical protein